MTNPALATMASKQSIRLIARHIREHETNPVLVSLTDAALQPLNAAVESHKEITQPMVVAAITALLDANSPRGNATPTLSEALCLPEVIATLVPNCDGASTHTPAPVVAPAPAVRPKPTQVHTIDPALPEGDRGMGEGWHFYPGQRTAKHAPIPVGTYALEVPGDEVNPVHFFDVLQRPEDGSRWAGWTFVERHSSDDRYPVKGMRRQEVMEAIAADPRGAAALYGHATNSCGICGRELTREDSRQRGIGPECAKKHGWL